MFKELKSKVATNFEKMAKNPFLFYVEIGRDEIVEKYLSGFNEEIRQEFNCSSCKSFLRQFGGIVNIENNKVISIWDNIDGEFANVAKVLSKYIHSRTVTDLFLNDYVKCGVNKNLDTKLNVVWEHFYIELPKQFIANKDSIPTLLNQRRTNKQVFKRSLDELTISATQTVLELIAQNSLYKGNESKGLLESFLQLQHEYNNLPNEDKDAFSWSKSVAISGALATIRNSAIGTLLIDLSEDLDVEQAVSKFEKVVAPSNYKRPTSLITPRMIEVAQKEIEALGFTRSLERRFANEADININNVLFTTATEYQEQNVFTEMVKSAHTKKVFNKVEEVSITDFIENVLPKAESVEVLFESKHQGNLVSLLTAQHEHAKSMFKWNNPFSWVYNGGVADSMKERVKAAGGKVDGVLRFSIQWNDNLDNSIDFDAHARQPDGVEIAFNTFKRPSITSMLGQLDVDVITPGSNIAVENITWQNLSKMHNGNYAFWVKNYSSMLSNGGFSAQIECDGELHEFTYEKNLKGGENIQVAEVNLNNGKFVVTPTEKVKHGKSSIEKWGLESNKFHKVNKIMLSPNHWEEQVGNKHYLFMVEGCKNEEQPRAIFNEFLHQDLDKHRKVFEVLGSKLQVEPTDNQLSGLGFSETQRNEVVVKVTGQMVRTLKVKF